MSVVKYVVNISENMILILIGYLVYVRVMYLSYKSRICLAICLPMGWWFFISGVFSVMYSDKNTFV